ncbi:MAG: DegT/DnrJ/EryC1/StrS family aminotransferase [Bacillota bacterium]
MKIEFYKHNLGEEEIRSVVQALNSIFLTTGPRVAEFEQKFASYLDAAYAVTTSSWTTGAFLTLKAWGIGPGDEVIVPAMTFIATANIVLHCGAVPVFVDVEPETGLIDVNLTERLITPKTKAVIPVHLYGQMADMIKLRSLADSYNLRILEDSAHCIEGERDGVKPGALGDAAAFSFYATKNITCGEGGAVVTNDADLAEKLKALRIHGMSKSAADRYTSAFRHWDMEILGYKANLTDFQAALLLNQLATIEEKWKRKELICRRYEEAFSEAGIAFPKVLPGSKSARHLMTVWVRNRDRVLTELQEMGIGVAVNFRAVHLMKYYRETFGYARGNYPVAEQIGDSTISLPLYPKLQEQEIDYVIKCVISAAGKS